MKIQNATIFLLVLLSTAPARSDAADITTAQRMKELEAYHPKTPDYKFDFIHGRANDVCVSFMRRLRHTEFSVPPYCGIPEDKLGTDLDPLSQTALTMKQVETLYERVKNFYRKGSQGSQEEDDAKRKAALQLGLPPQVESTDNIDRALSEGDIKVWKYEPPIEADGTAKTRNLIIWQGLPVSVSLGKCGITDIPSIPNSQYQPTQAVIVDDQYSRINEETTKRVFFDMRTNRPSSNVIGIIRKSGRDYWITSGSSHRYPDSIGISAWSGHSVENICKYSVTEKKTSTSYKKAAK